MNKSPRPQPEPKPDPNPPSFKFFAMANANILRGELVEFAVDSTGRVTSPKLDFIYTTPRLTKISPA